MQKKICVTIPTYKEEENIAPLIREILLLGEGYHVVVIDDSSPDRTGALVVQLARETGRATLLSRKGARGRGLAGRDGFKYALDQGAQVIIEMDADFSHSPQEIPRLLEALEDADIVVGSRFLRGSNFKRPGPIRNAITHMAGWLIKKVTGVYLTDSTSGFRAYRREVLSVIFEKSPPISWGPSILEEIQYKSRIWGFRFKEVPITFLDREKGKSTFNWRVALKVLFFVVLLPFLFGYLKKEPRETSIEIIDSNSPASELEEKG